MEISKLKGVKLRRILIAVFCVCIGICVAFVMLHVYDPNRNSLGALSSVCMDVICMIILLIIMASLAFEKLVMNKTTKLYVGLLLATIWAMFLDFLNWAFDGSLEFGELTFLFTLGSLCMGSILAGIFSMYLYMYMEETHIFWKMRTRAITCACLNLVSFVLTFILAITGTAFQFVDGHYETGVLYDVVTVIPIVTLLYLTLFVVIHVKTVGAHDAFAAAGYIIFMISGALIESFYRIGTTYVAVAIADIFIFVMLQNELIALEKKNAEEWMRKSNIDELTGFYNRNAYEADVEKLEKAHLDEDFVYVSMDLNALKTTNDSLGHWAGDELLVGASECIRQCFQMYGKLYRIGGDEFIALIQADKGKLDSIKKNMEELTQGWSGKLAHNLTISCGYVARAEEQNMTVRQMGILADQRMYEAKDEYYRSANIERRKK